jgi:mannose/fructose/N-acetylgalactosamine-specific phosphotransferase system component IID
MNNPLSSKLAALGLALAMNGALIGVVVYLFSDRVHATAMVLALRAAPAVAAIGV